jgi:hypothetical protein
MFSVLESRVDQLLEMVQKVDIGFLRTEIREKRIGRMECLPLACLTYEAACITLWSGLVGLFGREETGKLASLLFKFHRTHILEGGMSTNAIVNLSEGVTLWGVKNDTGA